MAVRKVNGKIKPKVVKPVINKEEEVKVEDQVIEETVENEVDEEIIEDEVADEVVEEKKVVNPTKKKKETEKKKVETSEKKVETKPSSNNKKKLDNPLAKKETPKKETTEKESDSYTRKDFIRDVAEGLDESFGTPFSLVQAEAIIKVVENKLSAATDKYSVRFMGETIRRVKRNRQISSPPKASFQTYKEERYVKTMTADIGNPAVYGGHLSDDKTEFIIESKQNPVSKEYEAFEGTISLVDEE